LWHALGDVRPRSTWADRSEDDHVCVGLASVHLDEDLVEGLLPFLVSAADITFASSTDCIDLIDEHDEGRASPGTVEQVANATGTDADNHLYELRAAHAEEADSCFTCDGASDQSLARAGRASDQHAFWRRAPSAANRQ
jgi:hypothetical protein